VPEEKDSCEVRGSGWRDFSQLNRNLGSSSFFNVTNITPQRATTIGLQAASGSSGLPET